MVVVDVDKEGAVKVVERLRKGEQRPANEELPAGIFLFTDIEGSTKLWEKSPKAMQRALAEHDEILHRVTEERDGYVFKIFT